MAKQEGDLLSAKVTGRVVNFPGVNEVFLCPDGAGDPLMVCAATMTDANGNFEFTNVDYPAQYKVSVGGIWFCKPVIVVNGPTINEDVTAVLTTAQADPPLCPFTCSGPPTIPVPANKAVLAGKITNPTGSGHVVAACDAAGNVKFQGNTNAGSWFRLVVDAAAGGTTYHMKIDGTWCVVREATVNTNKDAFRVDIEI
jgi:hypothetical protein